MNYQTVRLVSTFGSGSCVSSFGSSPKVETAGVSSFGLTQKWKLRTRFQFQAVSTLGPAQAAFFELTGKFSFITQKSVSKITSRTLPKLNPKIGHFSTFMESTIA